MLDIETRETVKATAPILQTHGEALTRHFYARMFEHNPELRPVFNQGNQRSGAQQQALAMAVAAYAENIDDPSVLLPVLERVANKHTSLGVRGEHYAIVGEHLLASIEEVLGSQAATPELIDAWAQAYGQLADLLIGMEQGIYDAAATRPGGWTGWRGFTVTDKRQESEEITSFHLRPADGGTVPEYQPGQYVTVRLLVPELGYYQPRQYSLSAAPGSEELRISVKRHGGDTINPQGMVSTLLHDTLEVGDIIDVAPPSGDVVLSEDDAPLVLISAGVGITPMMAMLDHAVATQPGRPINFLHSTRHGGSHAFDDHLRNVADEHDHVNYAVWYTQPQDHDDSHHHVGRINLGDHQEWALPDDAEIHICGPRSFIASQLAALAELGVPSERIHVEVFGTGGA